MVDNWIASGLSFSDIEKLCKSQLKLNVSHMSIKRYTDSDTELKQKRLDALNQNDLARCDIAAIDAADSTDILTVDLNDIPQDATEAKEFRRNVLRSIHAKHLLAIDKRLDLYLSGQGAYPKDELQGLKTVINCLIEQT